MSVKSFISAEKHLAKLGVTITQAEDFIKLNLENPKKIYEAAFDYGVTNNMLSEISHHSVEIVKNYFRDASVDPKLDPVLLDYTSILLNSDAKDLEKLIDYNNNEGVLAIASLREKVQPLMNDPALYDLIFDPVFDFQDDDNIYDSDELGVSHLTNVPATNTNIESLFYGTLLRIYLTLDESELNQIDEIKNIGDRQNHKELFSNSLTSIPTSNIWTDEALANHVITEASNLLNDYANSDHVIGVLDHSFLGFLV